MKLPDADAIIGVLNAIDCMRSSARPSGITAHGIVYSLEPSLARSDDPKRLVIFPSISCNMHGAGPMRHFERNFAGIRQSVSMARPSCAMRHEGSAPATGGR